MIVKKIIPYLAFQSFTILALWHGCILMNLFLVLHKLAAGQATPLQRRPIALNRMEEKDCRAGLAAG
jgi:hypothetical protein